MNHLQDIRFAENYKINYKLKNVFYNNRFILRMIDLLCRSKLQSQPYVSTFSLKIGPKEMLQKIYQHISDIFCVDGCLLYIYIYIYRCFVSVKIESTGKCH